MKLDFSKPAPQAQTLEEAQQIINALWAIIVELQAKVADLEEKLNTNSKNSSKSPSSDLFKTKKKQKQHGAGKSKALKQGAQKGHLGKGRELLPPEKVDSFVTCYNRPAIVAGMLNLIRTSLNVTSSLSFLPSSLLSPNISLSMAAVAFAAKSIVPPYRMSFPTRC
jgi:uncharacterized coiled-coil protein SlyX